MLIRELIYQEMIEDIKKACQVMKLGWMVFFELAVINIFLTAAILYFVK